MEQTNLPLGWGIVGIGSHADLKIAPAMKLADDANLVAVYSRDQATGRLLRPKAHGAAGRLQLTSTPSSPTPASTPSSSPPPTTCTPSQTIRAASAGKHVLAEKPMATTVSDAAAMVDACRDHGVKLGMGFELRFHPAHLWARQLLDDGTIGRIRLAHGQWGRGNRGEPDHRPRTGLREWWETPELIGDASVLVGLGVHVFDLMRFPPPRGGQRGREP